jgi:topoisomerase IV subunit B
MGDFAWTAGDGFLNSYCNTIPTPEGGTHEQGLRTALLRGLKELRRARAGNKRAAPSPAKTSDGRLLHALGVRARARVQGQTKDRLAPRGHAHRRQAMRDAFDHWLAASPNQASKLLDWAIERAEERLRRRRKRTSTAQTATRKLRLPGKLADCTHRRRPGRGNLHRRRRQRRRLSAKQARDRASQAVLPLRGKILNVAGPAATSSRQPAARRPDPGARLRHRDRYRDDDLRYDKIILMTDADVDGAHIASLLMTFFFQEMPKLIDERPPLPRHAAALPHHAGRRRSTPWTTRTRNELLETEFRGKGRSTSPASRAWARCPMSHLRETTMDPKTRTLLQVRVIDDRDETKSVDRLMGNRPEARFEFIQENAAFVTDSISRRRSLLALRLAHDEARRGTHMRCSRRPCQRGPGR